MATQMYFAGHELNGRDRILRELPADQRAKVIVAFGAGSADDDPGSKRGHFNIMLRRVKEG